MINFEIIYDEEFKKADTDGKRKEAFQRALNTWTIHLLDPDPNSTIKINIQVYLRDLSSKGLSGLCVPNGVLNKGDFSTSNVGVWYTSALAKYLAVVNDNKECFSKLNNDISVDMVVIFNEKTTWYAGEDPTGIGKTEVDFQSIALHEVAHGLGFIGLFSVDKNDKGAYGSKTEITDVVNPLLNTLVISFSVPDLDNKPSVYGEFTQVQTTNKKLTSYTNSSDDLYKALTGQNGDLCFKCSDSTSYKIYAPSSFEMFSSIDHITEGLMKPSITSAEIIRDVDPKTLNILSSLGWKTK
jgi:hypothetical protein